MSRATQINNIVIHCSAGFGNVESIQNFWKNNLKWKSKGYHFVIANIVVVAVLLFIFKF